MLRTATLKSGHTIQLECNAASPLIHKRLWNENLMSEFQKISSENTDDLLTFMERVIFTFAKTAELGTQRVLKYDNNEDEYIMFLSQFEIFELASDDILNLIVEMWGQNTKTDSVPKNQVSPQQENQP